MRRRTSRSFRTVLTYWLHVLDSCALDVPEAQGSLRLGATHCMHALYVPLTLAPQVIATAGTTRLGM